MSKRFFISETRTSDEAKRTALLKPREDIEHTLSDLGIQRVQFPHQHDGRHTTSAIAKVEEHAYGYMLWRKALSRFTEGDTVFIQYPPLNPCLWLHRILEERTQKGVRFVLVIHDLVSLRAMLGDNVPSWQKQAYAREESRALKVAWHASVHTASMRNAVVSLFAVDPGKLTTLGLFDYLIDEINLPSKHAMKQDPIVIAGNLSPEKVGYLYDLPESLPANLFGIGFDKSRNQSNLSYMGSYPSEELPQHLTGSFGLIWDGDSISSCTGAFGNYLRYNSPHKLSLYLACGIPVVIWEEAAQAAFVKRYGVGLVVRNLNDMPNLVDKLSEEEYQMMCGAAANMGQRLRSGWYTRRFVSLIS